MALRLEHIPGKIHDKYAGTARRAANGVPRFTGKISIDHSALDIPRRWRAPRMVFVNSMSDLFHESIPLEFIQRVFAVMNECQRHTFQVLTKRPERTLEVSRSLDWTPNIWLGTSVESAAVVDRVRVLHRIRAESRFLSCEPLLGPLRRLPLAGIDWVIVGGESGPGARPMAPTWAREIRDQCLEKDVAFFFKQWGGTNKKAAGRELDGRTWDAVPLTVSA